MVTTALLSSAFFPPVQWYQKLMRYPRIVIDGHEHFIKQTYHSRCVIASTAGAMALTVPVAAPVNSGIAATGKADAAKGKTDVADLMVSEHGRWRHIHWNALCSAYGESPFFEYYADDIQPFFEQKEETLLAYHQRINTLMCRLLDIEPAIEYTDAFVPVVAPGTSDKADAPLFQEADAISKDEAFGLPVARLADGTWAVDYRGIIRPKHPPVDPTFEAKPYYQVYRQKHDFLPNLSILDLLCNEGNEAVLYLQ